MAARYRHLSPAFLGEAVRSLGGVFGEFCYPGVTAPQGVLNRFGDTTNGEPIPRGKPWDREPISGKRRRKFGVSPRQSRVCGVFRPTSPKNGVRIPPKWLLEVKPLSP
jgi:hypothetical protein